MQLYEELWSENSEKIEERERESRRVIDLKIVAESFREERESDGDKERKWKMRDFWFVKRERLKKTERGPVEITLTKIKEKENVK